MMFPATPIKEDVPMKSHFAKGDAELTNFDYASHSGLESWSDADMSRDVVLVALLPVLAILSTALHLHGHPPSNLNQVPVPMRLKPVHYLLPPGKQYTTAVSLHP